MKIHNSRVQESGGFYCRTGETGSRGATPATGPHARNAGVRAHGEERTEGGGRRRKEGRMAGKRRGGRKEGRKGERTGAAPRTPPRHEALRGRRPERGLEWSPADSCASEIIRPSLARSPKAPAWACPEPWPAWTTVIGLVPGLSRPGASSSLLLLLVLVSSSLSSSSSSCGCIGPPLGSQTHMTANHNL